MCSDLAMKISSSALKLQPKLCACVLLPVTARSCLCCYLGPTVCPMSQHMWRSIRFCFMCKGQHDSLVWKLPPSLALLFPCHWTFCELLQILLLAMSDDWRCVQWLEVHLEPCTNSFNLSGGFWWKAVVSERAWNPRKRNGPVSLVCLKEEKTKETGATCLKKGVHSLVKHVRSIWRVIQEQTVEWPAASMMGSALASCGLPKDVCCEWLVVLSAA